MARQLCAANDCSTPLPPRARKWCSETCRQRIAKRVQKENARIAEGRTANKNVKPLDEGYTGPTVTREESADGRASARRGPRYVQFCQTEWPELIAKGQAKRSDAEVALGESGANISRWMAAYVEDKRNGRLQEEWERDEAILIDFKSFCDRYWPDEPLQPFHVEWADAITANGEDAGKLLLLAPQRHGKTSMLWKYAIWRICRDPDRRILWVAKTQGRAEESIGRIRQEFDHNKRLVAEMFGPGIEMAPSTGSGLSWTNSKMTISQRTKVLSAPTLAALGIGGSILGRDADDIIIDDPMDRKSSLSPTERDSVAEWFLTDFMSRKMPQTSVSYIGSRQHIDDLPGRILRDFPDDWDVLIYRAHDPSCTIPEREVDDHQSCVLWPAKRPWWWLYQQKKPNEAHFQRNYQNEPRDDATTYITADDLANIKDHTRRVGDIPSGSRLIAGIDPAEAKPVAAVLWGYDGIHRHVIDCIEAPASVVGLRHILKEWPARYGVREFVFEKNMAKSWLVDTEVKTLIDRSRLHIKQHYTSATNKNSNAIGPVAMFQRMRTEPPTITVPWGAGEGRDRIERLLRSWLTFDPDWAGHKHADDDLTMASWFPMPVIDSWERPSGSSMVVQYDTVSNPLGGF